MHRFASEIAQLRALGFAEGLPIEHSGHTQGVVARLESGRIGVAVEFLAHGATPMYSVVPLGAEESRSVASDMWDDIITDVRRRTPPRDDD